MPRTWEPRVVPGQERWNEVGRRSTEVHLDNFLNSVRTRKEPVENAVVGHRAASVAHLVNLSAKHKKLLHWDRARDNVKA